MNRGATQPEPFSSAAIALLWSEIEALKRPGVRRFELGRRFFELRQKYSERERKSGGQSAVVGHGEFEAQCIARGWAPRTVRDLVTDFLIERQRMTDPYAEPWAKTSAEKRRERRTKARSRRGRNATCTQAEDAVTIFARLLSFEVARTAYLLMAKTTHPDHGGDGRTMQLLNDAWASARRFYEEKMK
jgi:hypothetical protein